MAGKPLSPEDHRQRAARHERVGLVIAEDSGDEWGVVCLFYAAYHLARAALLEDHLFDNLDSCQRVHADLRPEDRPQSRHKGRRDRHGLVEFGVNDMVQMIYGKAVSRDYEALHQGSIAVRYERGLASGALGPTVQAYKSFKDRALRGELVSAVGT